MSRVKELAAIGCGGRSWMVIAAAILVTDAIGCSRSTEVPPPGETEPTIPGELAWLTSYQEAIAAADSSGKPILVDFTGSDWCIWCVRLRDEVFTTGEFAAWAKDNVVLLELDFPQNTPLPEEEKLQNNRLAEKYGVRGFPTILFLSSEGDELGRMGYEQGGPDPWIASAGKLLSANGTP